jgi:hypothetical protein
MATAKKGMSALTSLATTKVKAATPKKADKKEFICDDVISEHLKKYLDASEAIKRYTAEKAKAESFIKPEGHKKFMELVEKHGLAPESFLLSSKDAKSSMLYIVQDSYKYAELNGDGTAESEQAAEERRQHLQEKFGEDIIETKSEFVLNAELLDEHGETLVNLIKGCADFSQDVKEKLIQLKEKHTIAKGSINRLKEIAAIATTNCGSPVTKEEVFEEIKPTQQLKPRGSN